MTTKITMTITTTMTTMTITTMMTILTMTNNNNNYQKKPTINVNSELTI